MRGHNQQTSRVINLEPGHRLCQAFRFEGGKFSIVILDNACVFGPNPQIAGWIFNQRGKSIGGNSWRTVDIEYNELYSVITYQPIECRQPKITVSCLQNRIDRVLRQTVVRSPGIKQVV